MNRSPLKFFLVVFALTVPVWLIGGVPLHGPSNFPLTLSVLIQPFVPLIAASILVHRGEGLGGVRGLLKRAFDYRRVRNKAWYVPIIFLVPFIYLLTYGIMALAGLPSSGAHTPLLAIPILLVAFFILGMGEELGWMGYAADPLQERRSALTTSIILGLVWAIWHFVPLIQMGRTLTWIAWWTLSTVALRILIVWLYNNTGKSVFAAIVFHATSNLSLPVFPMDYDHASVQFTLGTITAMAAMIVTFLWGPKTLARFRYA
jgi:uncharacterized protein